jgi:hypothetical protein
MRTSTLALLASVALVVALALSVSDARSAAPDAYLTAVRLQQENKFNDNSVKSFVYHWFALFDRHVPVQQFHPLLADVGLEMRFPEAMLRSRNDFEKWYAGIGDRFQSNTHTLERVDVQVLGSGVYRVDLVVFWQALTKDGQYISFRAHQVWSLQDAEGPWPRVVRYFVEEAR